MNEEHAPSATLSITDEVNKLHGAPMPITAAKFLETDFPTPECLFPWLTAGGSSMVYGDRGLGKSYFLLSAAMHLAAGAEFLGWSSGQRTKVLYVDGEMQPSEIKSRLIQLSTMFDETVAEKLLDRVQIECDLARRYGLPHLGDPDSLFWWHDLAEAAGAEVIVLDSLMVLAPTTVEGDLEQWNYIKDWIRAQNQKGRAIVLAHHTNANGRQYGTKIREIGFDYIIRLTRPKGYDPSRPCHFTLEFDKNRGGYGPAFEKRLVQMNEADDATVYWQCEPADKRAQALRLKQEGMTVRAIAEELGTPRSTVQNWIKQGN